MVSRSFDNARKRREYLWLGTGFSLMALCMAARAAQAQDGNAAAAKDISPIVVAQQPTPVPDVSVTAPARRATSNTQKRRPARSAGTAKPANTPPAQPGLQQPAGPPPEGSEAAGYKPNTVKNFGPLGQKDIQDVPYSVHVIPAPLIENTLSSTPDDLYRMDPVLQPLSTTSRGDSPNFIVRGITLGNANGKAEDGIILQNVFYPSLEDKERVEVNTGLTSFLYGANNVGGVINYVYKQPTTTPLENVTIGNYGGGSNFIHGDFGGPIDKEGNFSYRLNVVGQDGNTPIDAQNFRKDLVSAAVSWRPTNDLTLTVLGSHTDERMLGAGVGWNFATNPDGSSKVFHPAAPNASENFGQPWAEYAGSRDRVATTLDWKLTDNLTWRAGYTFSSADLADNYFVNNNVTSNNGTYSQTALHNTNFYYYANGAYTFWDVEFYTDFVHHKVTIGSYGNDFSQDNAPTTYASTTFNGLNFQTPIYFPEPNFPASNGGPVAPSTYNSNTNVIVGDDIKFNNYWSALLGLNYSVLTATNFNTSTRQITSAYDQDKVTPSTSLIFKPVSWLSTYATYSQSLQQGQVVANSGAQVFTNNGTTLPPYLGSEYEIGAKANVGGVLLTAAVFEIEQANQYAQYNNDGTYTYVQNGRQDIKGVEFLASGKVTENLRIFGGVTFLDPKVTQSQTSPTSSSIDGTRPVGVALSQEKITAEYDLPFAPGLTLTGGIYSTGRQAVDIRNTEYLPAFVTADVGFRYRTRDWFGQPLPFGQEIVYRFDVKNVANKDYWLTSSYVGQPRTYLMSAQLKF